MEKTGQKNRKNFGIQVCAFFCAFTALVLLVFLAGNFQGFAPSSLFLVLDMLKGSAFLCLAAAAACLVRLLVAAASKRPPPPRLAGFVLALLCLLFGLGVLVLSQFIIGLTLPKF
jgi:hypothetical protein